MAGLALFYIAKTIETTTTSGGATFTVAEHETDSWYGTQALADAAAVAGGEDFSANQGAVAVPVGWEKGWIRNPLDGTWRQFDVADLDELGQRKYAAGVLHKALLVWEAGVRDVEHEKPIIDVHRALDFLCFGHWANYVVFVNANGTWTAAQQIAWAYAMTAGAADISTVQEFFQNAHTIAEDEVPQEACAWVNPNDAVAVITKEARRMSTQNTQPASWFDGEETDLTMITLGNGAWIEEIT